MRISNLGKIVTGTAILWVAATVIYIWRVSYMGGDPTATLEVLTQTGIGVGIGSTLLLMFLKEAFRLDSDVLWATALSIAVWGGVIGMFRHDYSTPFMLVAIGFTSFFIAMTLLPKAVQNYLGGGFVFRSVACVWLTYVGGSAELFYLTHGSGDGNWPGFLTALLGSAVVFVIVGCIVRRDSKKLIAISDAYEEFENIVRAKPG